MLMQNHCIGNLEANGTPPLVSVIILNWNQKKLLKQCLDSVLCTDYARIEIIVSDNGSVDGSIELVKNEYSDVVLIENHANLGFCNGNNVAIKQAKGDLILLLNNDTFVEKNWLKEVVKAACEPNVGIVGCKLLFAGTNVIQSLGYVSNLLGHYVNRGFLHLNDEKCSSEQVVDVDYVSGAALAIKRAVITEIGSLDPIFYAYFEDVDWCYRVKTAGYRVVVAEKAVVHHFGSLSWREFSFRKVYLTERNRFVFLLKHFSGLNLVNALFVNEFKNVCGLVKNELNIKRSPSVAEKQETPGVYADMVSRSDYVSFAKATFNWVSAKFLAYLSLGQLIFRNRKANSEC